MQANPALATLDRLVGDWTATGAHPLLPGRVLRGRMTLERLDGGAFIRMHTRMDDAEIPEGVAIFGTDPAGAGTMLYFDVRGVARVYAVALRDDGFTWSRDGRAPDFAQRFDVEVAPDGRSMRGKGSMKKPGAEWEPDLSLDYQRR
jgi:hypothetical protein